MLHLNHSILRKVIDYYSIFAGASAAIPLTYLAIQATKNISLAGRVMLIIPAFLGPASVRSNSMNAALNEGLNWIDSLKEETVPQKRNKLISAMTTISSAIDELPDEPITKLYFNFFLPDVKSFISISERDEDLSINSSSRSRISETEKTALLPDKDRSINAWLKCGIL